MEETEFGMDTEVSAEQQKKAALPIDMMEFGMVVFLQPTINLFVEVSIIALQLSRESYVRLFLSTIMEFSPLQSLKAPIPIDVIELGMVTFASLEQPKKAASPIDVTEFGMTVFLQPTINLFVAVSIIALQLSRESYVPLFLSTFMEYSPEQWQKALSPI